MDDTLEILRRDAGLTQGDVHRIEKLIYVDPEPPSTTRFKHRLAAISSLDLAWMRYRYRVYARWFRMRGSHG